jgi:hypothetical protein
MTGPAADSAFSPDSLVPLLPPDWDEHPETSDKIMIAAKTFDIAPKNLLLIDFTPFLFDCVRLIRASFSSRKAPQISILFGRGRECKKRAAKNKKIQESFPFMDQKGGVYQYTARLGKNRNDCDCNNKDKGYLTRKPLVKYSLSLMYCTTNRMLCKGFFA